MQSSNITIENLHLVDSQANKNNLVHISLSKDLIFDNVKVLNVSKSSPGMIALFNVFQLQSWGQNNQIMKYNISNLNFEQSSISVFNVESYQPLDQETEIIITFHNITIQNINVQGKEALFKFNPTNQTKLSFQLDTSVIKDNQLELGYMIDLRQNSNNISITNTYFFNNSGMIMKTQPYELNDINQQLRVNIQKSRFFKNWANESLFHISANSLATIQNSSFEENFSLGRGSIIFSELNQSRVSISQSLFKKNYALTGGVFFSTLNGFIEAASSFFIENFALSGGVFYSQNEGYALLRDNNYTENLALKGSLIYAINCYNSIIVSGGLISRNGFQYHPEFLNPQMFDIKLNQIELSSNQYFDQRFITKIKQILSIDNNIFKKYLLNNERSHQISMVKAQLILRGKILITEQDLLIKAQSQSNLEIREAVYENSMNQNETIFIEQSNIVLSNFTIQNISSSFPIFQIESDSILSASGLSFNNCLSSLLKIQQSKCYFNGFKAQTISLDNNEKQQNQQLIKILYSQVNFTNSAIMNINSSKNIGEISEKLNQNTSSKSDLIVIYAKKSFINCINLNASNIIGQLIFMEQASQLNLSFSSITNGKQSNDQSQGTAITLLDSNSDIRSSSFFDIQGLSGSAIYAQNSPLFYSKTSITVQNSTFRRIFSAQRDGGGSIQIQNLDAQLFNNSFIQNKALMGSGGALRLLCTVVNSKSKNYPLIIYRVWI